MSFSCSPLASFYHCRLNGLKNHLSLEIQINRWKFPNLFSSGLLPFHKKLKNSAITKFLRKEGPSLNWSGVSLFCFISTSLLLQWKHRVPLPVFQVFQEGCKLTAAADARCPSLLLHFAADQSITIFLWHPPCATSIRHHCRFTGFNPQACINI